MNPLIYLSYRIKGAGQHAERLSASLQSLPGLELFGDQSIQPGEHWPTVLQKGLDRSSALIVLIDEDWLKYQDQWGRRRIDDQDDWVHREIAHAINRNIRLLPVLIDGTRMPPSEALPTPLRALAEVQAARLRLDHFDEDLEAIREWVTSIDSDASAKSVDDRQPFRIDRIELSDFRCFEHLELDLTRTSTLPGDWTCVAGINGAGKSSILQAVSLLLMGPEYARELGGRRLGAMRRSEANGIPRVSILRAWGKHFGDDIYLEMSIDESGPNAVDRTVWRKIEGLLNASYGAGRNLSDADNRWHKTSDEVQAHVSLFDPLAPLNGAEYLLQFEFPKSRTNSQEDLANQRIGFSLFRSLLDLIFPSGEVSVMPLSVESGVFRVGGSPVGSLGLPDGFRSSCAWMADLCFRACSFNPQIESLDEIKGIILIDEIDLHLHPSLQRSIIPRLRNSLPNVQFIVTSHSPLILSSFDRNELILLDRDECGGIRELDRQILGFSSDDVYNWLMGTSPHSLAFDQKMENANDVDLLLYQSPHVDEAEAKARQQEQLKILEEMQIEDGDEF